MAVVLLILFIIYVLYYPFLLIRISELFHFINYEVIIYSFTSYNDLRRKILILCVFYIVYNKKIISGNKIQLLSIFILCTLISPMISICINNKISFDQLIQYHIMLPLVILVSACYKCYLDKNKMNYINNNDVIDSN